MARYFRVLSDTMFENGRTFHNKILKMAWHWADTPTYSALKGYYALFQDENENTTVSFDISNLEEVFDYE